MPVMMTTCLLVVTHEPARIMESGLEMLQSVNVSNCHGLLVKLCGTSQSNSVLYDTFLLQ